MVKSEELDEKADALLDGAVVLLDGAVPRSDSPLSRSESPPLRSDGSPRLYVPLRKASFHSSHLSFSPTHSPTHSTSVSTGEAPNGKALNGEASDMLMVWHGDEWRWLNTVAFGVAVSFAMGSMLFIVGAATSMAAPLLEELGWQRRVLVDYAYMIGACYFEIGAYLGWFEVINVGKTRRRLWAGPSEGVSAAGYWGALFYFIGATSFGLSCAVVLYMPEASHTAVVLLEWAPQVVGGACFTIAAAIEQWHNRDAGPGARVSWLCHLYLGGSALFLLAAATGFGLSVCEVSSERATMLGVDLPYLLGSICFLGGAWLQVCGRRRRDASVPAIAGAGPTPTIAGPAPPVG